MWSLSELSRSRTIESYTILISHRKEMIMSVKVLYQTSARATGGRDGHSATLDGAVDVKLSTPKELGGAGGPGVNPEQLFATGYAACFLGAIKTSEEHTSELQSRQYLICRLLLENKTLAVLIRVDYVIVAIVIIILKLY